MAARYALAFCLAAGAAGAHTRSQSHSVWEINGADVNLIMTIPAMEIDRLSPNATSPSDDEVKRYLTPRVYALAADKRCELVPPVETLSAANGFRKYDFTFKCASPGDLKIHSGAFFDLIASHTNFAQIQNVASGEFIEQLITHEHQTVEVTGGERSRLKNAQFFEFVEMGTLHIFTGVDHMSFLLGLVLISRRLRDLVFVVTGFTIGHSLTLALAVTGVLRPHAEYIDALVALTIALIGAENIVVQTGRSKLIALGLGGCLALMALFKALGFGGLPSLLLLGAGLFTANYLMISGNLRDAGRLRMLITLVFGLIHGFGFAADLLQLQLPPERLAELLVGFNLGVELGQLTLVVSAAMLVLGLRKFRLALPRPIVVDVASAFLVGLGTFWFVSRSFV
ncbi:MAG TPA: HupE/UreJ family protein [Steroidobacteraceae bacterium]